jgi:hypothetical protein
VTEDDILGLTLWSTDVLALATFLERTAALQIEERHPGFATLRAGAALIAIHADESYRGHPWYDALRREGAARGIGAEVRFRVQDPALSYREALRLGAVAIQPPSDVDGVEESIVMGPDGFLFTYWAPNETGS